MHLSARAALRAPCVHILAPASSCPVRAAPSGPGHRLAVTVLAACFLVAVVPVGLDPACAHLRPGLVEILNHRPRVPQRASGIALPASTEYYGRFAKYSSRCESPDTMISSSALMRVDESAYSKRCLGRRIASTLTP